MDTLLRIVALIRAVQDNDVAATARLLDELEDQLDPAELADILEAIFGEGPTYGTSAATAAPVAALCA